MSDKDLRCLMAAQFLGAMATKLSPNTPDNLVKDMAEFAAKAAKILEEAVIRSRER